MSDPAGAQSFQRAAITRFWPEICAGVALLLTWLSLARIPLPHDVVWQLWIARHLLAGEVLYSQIMEVNPPLWFWMAVPAQQLASVINASPAQVLTGAVFGLIALSLTLIAALGADQPPRARAFILFAVLLALILVPLASFAQREHLCLIAALPYTFLIARRAEGQHLPWMLAVTIGLFAAPFFALKHYFVLVPLLLEIWLLYRLRHRWRPIRPEALALASIAVIYVLAILAFTPGYMTQMVPLLSIAYGDFGASLPAMIDKPSLPALVLATFFFWHFRAHLQPPTQAALVTTVAFVIAYAVQMKGWSYQTDPIAASVFVAFAIQLGIQLQRQRTAPIEGVMVVVFVACALLPPLIAGPYRNPAEPFVSPLLQDVAPGESVAVLSSHPSRAWPMIETHELVWPLRYMSFWMLYAIANQSQQEGLTAPEIVSLADRIRAETVADLQCNPPRRIIVDTVSLVTRPEFDILAFFSKASAFRELMSHYTPAAEAGVLVAYERKDRVQLASNSETEKGCVPRN